MAVTAEPNHHDQPHSQNHHPKSPHPETLDLPNSPVLDKHEDALFGDQKHSGTPVMSPTNKRIKNLTVVLNPIPFIPLKKLDLDKHEELLKRLGLHDFTKIQFDTSFRTDLILQFIANYDSKNQCSYVNDFRVSVSRADLATALKLPPATASSVDLDSEAFSDEAIQFIEEFVSNWLVLHEVMPADWTRCIRDGHPEQLDLASLIWYNVEKELSQGDKLVDCYYAPHLQYLIRSQRHLLFDDEKEEDEEVAIDQEQKIELNLGTDHVEERACEGVKNDDEMMAEAEESYAELEAPHDISLFSLCFPEHKAVEDEEEEEQKHGEKRWVDTMVYAEDDSIDRYEPDSYIKWFVNNSIGLDPEADQKFGNVMESSVEPEENQDEVNENDATMESVPADAPEDEKEEDEEVAIDQEQKIELNLGTDVEERACEGVKNGDEMMAEAEESYAELEAPHDISLFSLCFPEHKAVEDEEEEEQKHGEKRWVDTMVYAEDDSIDRYEPDSYIKWFVNNSIGLDPEADQKFGNVMESSVEPEENQDEVNENDATMESVPADAPEEKGGGEEH